MESFPDCLAGAARAAREWLWAIAQRSPFTATTFARARAGRFFEIERQREPVMVVAHNAIIRVLHGYLSGIPRESVPHTAVPLHTVIGMVPKAYGCDETRTVLER